MLRTTYTFAILEVSKATFDEIYAKLKEHYGDQIFHGIGDKVIIDMHGIGLQQEGNDPPVELKKSTQKAFHDFNDAFSNLGRVLGKEFANLFSKR